MTGADSFAFTAGVLAALNPCGLAMLPSYLAFFIASETGATAERDTLARLLRGLAVAATVSLGVVATFVLAGLAISWGVSQLGQAVPVFGVALGAALVGLGVVMLLGGRVPGLRVAATAQRDRGMVAMAWFGVAYGLGSLSCSLPVFLIVVGTSAAETARSGAIPFLAFAAGMSAVITCTTIIAALFTGLVTQLHHVRRHIPTVSGLLLLAAGIYVIHTDLPLAIISTGHTEPSSHTVAATTTALTLIVLAITASTTIARRHVTPKRG